jgi:uncharacterized protein (DUF1330 family)
MSYLWPTESQNQKFSEQQSKSGTITMLNLLRYRATADYKDSVAESPCSGREAYKRYAEQVFPILESHKAKVVFAGAAMSTVIGPQDEQWDDVLIVEYPSQESFVAMINSAEYQNVAHHREAALDDSRLVSIDTAGLSYNDS